MGLIREPKDVDFYVIDKAWTEDEKKELSEFIKTRKEQREKRKASAARTKKNNLRDMPGAHTTA